MIEKKKYYEYYPNDNSNSNSNKKYGRSRYKSKYKKKTSDNCGSNNNWSVRDKDVIYDLS